MTGRILIVDDEESMCELIEADLGRRGYECAWRTSADEAFALARGGAYDMVLTDLNMPGVTGIELCTRMVENRPDVPVVVMTAFGSLATAIEAIRAGAFDFVTKPFEMDHLAIVVERALRHHRLQEKVRVLSAEIDRGHRFDEMLGESPVMLDLFNQLAHIADSETSVLVVGESGTGKELAARALHRKSRRRERPLVAINCAAIPETLLESVLFGHVKGAFTDARDDQTGIFVQADGGTLFLDEIGDLPLGLQPKLLRALEERTIRPVGGAREIGFDVRFVSATNRDLEAAVVAGGFREDLFYRINVIEIGLPPLRARGMDVLLIAQRFIEEFASRNGKPVEGLAQAAAERLLVYPWPGNVRELRNAMERAVALTQLSRLGVEDLPERVRDYRRAEAMAGDDEEPGALCTLAEIERRHLLLVMDAVGGNRTLAARVLGIDRKTLYRKLRSLGFDGESAAN